MAGALVGATGLLAVPLATAAPASAAVPGAVTFAQSSFTGYSAADEAHVGLANLSSTQQVAGVTQAFSGASAVSPNGALTKSITGDNGGTAGSGLLVQPAQPATVRAFGTGTGLSAGVGAAPDGSGNQLNQAGQATQVAPPNGTPVQQTLPTAGGLNLPGGLASAGVLNSEGAAFYDPTSCPLGQPLSYGTANAANANVVNFSSLASGNPLSSLLSALPLPSLQSAIPGLSVPTSGSLISSSGVSESDSETFLSSNGDGTFGYTTQAREIIAPVSVNLFGAAQLNVTVSGSQTDPSVAPGPVTLTATTTGESSGAKVTVQSNDFVGVTLTAGSTTTALLPPTSLQQLIGQGGITLDLNPSTLVGQLSTQLPNLLSGTPLAGAVSSITGALSPVLDQVGAAITGATASTPLNVSFGTISIGTPIRAINSSPAATPPAGPVTVGGTSASGAIDIARLHLGLTVPSGSSIPASAVGPLSDIGDVNLGHLEASATDQAPILCSLPVVKASNPTQVSAGGQFVYTIQIPDPAKLDDLACNLTNVNAVDTISDATGNPTFTVASASNDGVITQPAPPSSSATVNWTGLGYTLGSQPITLTITVTTPANSPAGVIQDVVNATGTASGCTGGASGIADLGGINGNVLTGSYTLQQPSVLAAGTAPASATAAQLPYTGGPGGLWQPLAGVAALGLGVGALALVRRNRRAS